MSGTPTSLSSAVAALGLAGGSSSHGGRAAVTWAARCSPRPAPGGRETDTAHRRMALVAVVTAVTVAAAELVNRTATR